MEVCVVPEREELPKERSYGEGGVGILSFHMGVGMMTTRMIINIKITMKMILLIIMTRRRKSLTQLFASLYYCLMISQAYCKSSASYNLPFL